MKNQLGSILNDIKCKNKDYFLHRLGELCVCELMEALGDSQPKISRHLAQLRNCGVLTDTRRGQWVFYSLARDLPDWVYTVLDGALKAQKAEVAAFNKNLKAMQNRPSCC